jgi:hypothetical protein
VKSVLMVFEPTLPRSRAMPKTGQLLLTWRKFLSIVLSSFWFFTKPPLAAPSPAIWYVTPATSSVAQYQLPQSAWSPDSWNWRWFSRQNWW